MPPAVTLPTTPAAPNTGLFAKPGESILDYEARLGGGAQSANYDPNVGAGKGFGTPQPVAANLVPPPQGGTQGEPDSADSLGSAQDKAAIAAGYTSWKDALDKLTAPSQDTTDFYNSAYSAAGLDTLANQITQKQNDLNTATGNINDNPWLDEANRVGRVKNLTTMATADIKNLTDQYNTKLKSVHDLVTQHAHDLSATDAANKAKLSFLEAQAKDKAAQTTAQAKTAAAAPKTIKGANGATFQYDPTTGTFTQILPGKAPAAPKTPAAQKPFQFTPKQITALSAQGLPSSDASGILSDIQAGHPLEDIRQQMKASGLDPGLLDTIMYYVDPAHNTPAKKTSTPTTSAIPGISVAARTPVA